MNKDDFRRNFQQSYFGLQPSLAKSSLSAELWQRLDLADSENPLIPCTSPSFLTGDRVSVSAVLKLIDGSTALVPIVLQWKDDMDEDLTIMQAQHPMRLGMIQARDTCVFLRRYPQRNYNRGYTPRSCVAWTPNQFTVREDGGVSAHDYYLVWHVFNPYSKTLEEALDILDSGEKIGVVLGPWLGVYLESGKRFPKLAYRNETIGFVQNRLPVVYEGTSDVAMDYILKITGKYPKVK